MQECIRHAQRMRPGVIIYENVVALSFKQDKEQSRLEVLVKEHERLEYSCCTKEHTPNKAGQNRSTRSQSKRVQNCGVGR